MIKFLIFFVAFNILLITVNAVCKSSCNKMELSFYEDIGCKPKFSGELCPSYFSCPKIVDEGKCYYQGKYFEIGDAIKPTKPCHSCSCRKNGDGKVAIVCRMAKCFVPRDNETCYYPDNLEKCCKDSSEVVCGPRGSCNIDETEIGEGEKFTPQNTCLNCICSKKDNFKYNKSSCKREVCDIAAMYYENFKNYCAPLYYGNEACCPDSFVCPEEIKMNTPLASGPNEGEKCKFGTKTYNKGDKFSLDVKYKYDETNTYSVTCECSLPPFLTCINSNN